MAEPAQALTVSIPSTPPERWSFANRLLFRFAFVYLILYCWPGAGRTSLLDAIPSFGIGALNDDNSLSLTKMAQAPWRALCPWVAVHVFHLQGAVTKYHPTGSGDTTLDYILVFCFAVIALTATLVWSALDRRRPSYRTMYAWLRLIVRFTLAFTLLAYGFAKVYPMQFRTPFLSTLTETYGEASPMGILWTFMGASPAYTKFCGLAEVLGGVLLLFRRTATLGALVAMADMANVVMLNFSYDVPVKLYSSHLLMMSCFLLIPDAAALAHFFFLQQASRLEGVWPPRIERRHLRIGALVFQGLVICSVLYNNIWGGYQFSKQSATFMKVAPLYGIWNADAAQPWSQLAIHLSRFLSIREATGTRTNFNTAYDEAKHTLKITAARLKREGEFTYSQPDPQHLILRGTMNGAPMVAQFHRLDESGMLLLSRGFHWINEDPFNR